MLAPSEAWQGRQAGAAQLWMVPVTSGHLHTGQQSAVPVVYSESILLVWIVVYQVSQVFSTKYRTMLCVYFVIESLRVTISVSSFLSNTKYLSVNKNIFNN